MNKINTHKLLTEYHNRPNYPDIAKFAASLISTYHDKPEEILNAVKGIYGEEVLPQYKDIAGTINTFGGIGELIPYNALEQMQSCMRIPPAKQAALMPDAHKGYGLPIGGVIELENSISPGYIGFDISCMMMLSVFDIAVQDFMDKRNEFTKYLQSSTIFGVGKEFDTPNDHSIMEDSRWNITDKVKGLHSLAYKQLGTSGGGNHFADLVIIKNPAYRHQVGLLTHSGSRGIGHRLATYYSKLAEKITRAGTRGVPRGHGWLDMNSDAGKEYWEVMQLMGDYALACHETIHASFAKNSKLEIIDSKWNRHNFAWKGENNNYIHRKGATPAHKGETGLIPGTSGSLSYITSGLGNPNSLFSSSHGAGRPYSRTESRRLYSKEEFTNHMDKEDIIHIGVAPDETVKAYKNIEDVMKAQDNILIKRIASMEPKVVIMGGRADDGD